MSDASEIAGYLDEFLRVSDTPDWKNALNGLQVDSSGGVSKVLAAVDASEASIRAAVESGANLLLVHHGLFWDGNRPVTGRRYRRLKLLLGNDIALYSAHLPLDVHPELGNNALLADALGVERKGRFGEYSGTAVGVWGEIPPIARSEFADRVRAAVGGDAVTAIEGGPETVSRVGILTGGGGSMVADAIAAGLDTLVTGEGSHHTYFDAMEGGINLYYAGHYATEVFGVRALARHVAERFGLEWEFADLPTGL